MNARPGDLTVQGRHTCTGQLLLLMLLIAANSLLWPGALAPAEDPRLVLMCKMPRVNGEAMFVTMRSNRYECWDNLQ